MSIFFVFFAAFLAGCSFKEVSRQEVKVKPNIGGLRVIEQSHGLGYGGGQSEKQMKELGHGYEYDKYLLYRSPWELATDVATDAYTTIHRGMSIQKVESKLGTPVSEYFNILPLSDQRA